jgi:hypothetical protein
MRQPVKKQCVKATTYHADEMWRQSTERKQRLTSVGIAVGNKCGNKRRVVELDQLVGTINANNWLVLLQSQLGRLVQPTWDSSWKGNQHSWMGLNNSSRGFKPHVLSDCQMLHAVLWVITWSLARANVHPRADSVKGGVQLGALAISAWCKRQEKTCEVSYTDILQPTSTTASFPSIGQAALLLLPFFLPLKRTTPSRSVTTADNKPSTLSIE